MYDTDSKYPVFKLRKHLNKIVFPVEFDLVDLAKEYSIFPLKVIRKDGKKKLLLAMRDPELKEVIAEIEYRTRMPVVIVVTTHREVRFLIRRYYHLDTNAQLPRDTSEQDISLDPFEMTQYIASIS